MSRYRDYDDYEGLPEQILAAGRWKRNARAVLRSRRGRKALADLRDALLALPEPRLIHDAMCTVGPALERFPLVTRDEARAERDRAVAWYSQGISADPDRAVKYGAYCEDNLRAQRDLERADFEKLSQSEGEGVCAVAAYIWHQKVLGGADPVEAFAGLPALTTEDGDSLHETADFGTEAGLAYTLAWELAYRNDETFGRMTPEERHAAFLAWINGLLAEPEKVHA